MPSFGTLEFLQKRAALALYGPAGGGIRALLRTHAKHCPMWYIQYACVHALGRSESQCIEGSDL
jgi:hypothetical protein